MSARKLHLNLADANNNFKTQLVESRQLSTTLIIEGVYLAHFELLEDQRYLLL